MALLSPGVELRETSIRTTVVRNATGRAAMVGKFGWGAAYQITQVTNEVELVDLFGTPTDENADYFMSAMNFLQYGNDLRLVRAVDETVAKNASPIAGNLNITIQSAGTNYKVGDSIRVKLANLVIEANGKVTKVAPVEEDGRILEIFVPSKAVIDHAKKIGQYPALGPQWTVEVSSSGGGVGASLTLSGVIVDSGILLTDNETANEKMTNIEFQAQIARFHMPALVAAYPGELGSSLEVEVVSYEDYVANTKDLTIYPFGGTRKSSVRQVFPYGPQRSGQYAITVRRNGNVVESKVLSTIKGDRDIYQNNIYMDDYFSRGSSRYVYGVAEGFPAGFSGIIQLQGGITGNSEISAGDLIKGWDLFSDREELHVNLMIAGCVAGESLEIASTVQKYVSALADTRMDCVAFVSPPRDLIVNVPTTRAVDNMVNWRQGTGSYIDNNMNVDSTYTFIDGNYKYQYDKYNDVNRWIPLAADIAGLCARTDSISQPWMSPAGYNRGQILNTIKFAVSPKQSQRDSMYMVSINPVVGFSGGSGFVLLGDKMATSTPSPMDRINVRRLFNMLKKNIGDTAKYRLMELNDNFTRNSFRMETSQYLKGIEALGGIYEFRVVCDTTNNTPAVIDRNEFVADIQVKPAKSINFITLNFQSVDTGVDFDEVIGR